MRALAKSGLQCTQSSKINMALMMLTCAASSWCGWRSSCKLCSCRRERLKAPCLRLQHWESSDNKWLDWVSMFLIFWWVGQKGAMNKTWSALNWGYCVEGCPLCLQHWGQHHPNAMEDHAPLFATEEEIFVLDGGHSLYQSRKAIPFCIARVKSCRALWPPASSQLYRVPRSTGECFHKQCNCSCCFGSFAVCPPRKVI